MLVYTLSLSLSLLDLSPAFPLILPTFFSSRRSRTFPRAPKIHPCKIYLARPCARVCGRAALTSGIRDDSGTEIYPIDEQKNPAPTKVRLRFFFDPPNGGANLPR